jgi:type II secretion system protein I
MKATATGNCGYSQGGFTLLEVVVAMGLVATALIAVISLQSQNLRLQSEARFVTLAQQLAAHRLAQLRSEGTPEVGIREGDFGQAFEHMRYKERISEDPEFGNLYRVRLDIILDHPQLERSEHYECDLYGRAP